MSTEELDEQALARIVTERGVRYEVLRDDAAVDGQVVHTGLRVDLLAPSKHAEGCAYAAELACPAVFADLAKIARSVLPRAVRDSFYDLDGFDRSLHLDPHRHFEEEVRLVIHVRHRGSLDQPIDECQRRCVREISEALSRLGAKQR